MAAPVARQGLPRVTARLSALVIGQVCDASGCRESVVRAEGWVDSADAWAMAFHLPSDPLRGASATGDAGGRDLLRQWAAMLEAAGPLAATDREVPHAPQEKSPDAEGCR